MYKLDPNNLLDCTGLTKQPPTRGSNGCFLVDTAATLLLRQMVLLPTGAFPCHADLDAATLSEWLNEGPVLSRGNCGMWLNTAGILSANLPITQSSGTGRSSDDEYYECKPGADAKSRTHPEHLLEI